MSGAGAIAHLTNGSHLAMERLQPHRVQLQKELQRRANEAALADNRVLEHELQDWARVIIDCLGGHKLGGVDEDAGESPPEREFDEEEEEEPLSPDIVVTTA
jgi:hypothetical protein